MGGLKNAWEIGMEKSDDMLPELKKKSKLSKQQKEKIAEIRKEYQAKIADHDVMLQHKLGRMGDRIPPEEIEAATEHLRKEFAEEKERLEKEMEEKVQSAREESQ